MSNLAAAAEAMGAKPEKARAIVAACARFDIDNPLEQAHLLAQFAHETGGFTTFVENLNYRADKLRAIFGLARISALQAQQYGRTPTQKADQVAIANIVYGGEWGKRNLGNTQPGDGWKFRGSGDIQITGRDNYTRCSRAVYGDDRLVSDPGIARTNEGGSLCGAWFWATNKCGVPARRNDIRGVTRIINRGMAGLDDRIAKLAKAVRVMGI